MVILIALNQWSLHLSLDHGETVGSHFRHHPQDINELVFSDVLHQTIQSDEGPRPADSGAEHQRHTHSSQTQASHSR